MNFTINWIVEDGSGAFDAAGTADRSSHIPQLDVVGLLLRGSLFIVLNLRLKENVKLWNTLICGKAWNCTLFTINIYQYTINSV